MFDLFLELVNAINKHGISWAALVALLIALLKNRGAIIKLLRRDQARETQLDIIEHKVDLLLKERGLWDAANRNSSLNTALSSRKLLQAVGLSALIAVLRMDRTKQTIYSRRSKMKTLLQKYSSTKLQALVVATVMNVALLVGYIMNVQDVQEKVAEWTPIANLIVQTVLTIAYQWTRSSVDKEEIKATAEIANAVDPKESESHYR